MLANTVYGFQKIGRRKWREVGFWSKAQIVNALRLSMELSRKYPNAKFKVAGATTVCLNGYEEKLSDKDDNLTIYITFKNNSDEAEFVMREMS